MNRNIFLSFLFVGMVLFSVNAADKPKNLCGTYGVCESDPSHIELKLEADNTFHYKDLSNPGSSIQVSGTWVQKGNKVILKSNQEGPSFHRTWRISEDGTIAKSRNGLSFYRLARISG